jgi:ATP-dependent protease ClpP protease subunit
MSKTNNWAGAIGMGCVCAFTAVMMYAVKRPAPAKPKSPLETYEEKNNTKVIQCIGEINKEMSNSVCKAVREAESMNKNKLDVLLHTNGGMVHYTRVILKCLQSFDGTVDLWIPSIAMSSGTILALCMLSKGKVHVRKCTFFGPVDATVNGYERAVAKAECDILKDKANANAVFGNAIIPLLNAETAEFLKKYCFPTIKEENQEALLNKVLGCSTTHSISVFDEKELMEAGVPFVVEKSFPSELLALHTWSL